MRLPMRYIQASFVVKQRESLQIYNEATEEEDGADGGRSDICY